MQITILGNSNSLLSDGWFQAFRKQFPDDIFLNISVGGSPSPALLYQLYSRASEAQKSDILIIEPTVVDHGTAWQNPALVATYAEATIEKAKATGARVMLLVLPRKADEVIEPSPGMIAWSGAAKRASIEIIDIRSKLLENAKSLECDLEALWRDDRGHLTADMQVMVGDLMTKTVRAIEHTKSAANDIPDAYRMLSGEDIAKAGGIELVVRSTSLISVGCAQLIKGDLLSLDMEKSEVILGFMLNYGVLDHTQPTFVEFSSLDGADTKKLNLSNPFLFAKPSRTLVAMFKVVALPAGLSQLKLVGNDDPNDSTTKVEFVGVFIGLEPVPSANWDKDGISVLSAPTNDKP